jgi:hypothetical protein
MHSKLTSWAPALLTLGLGLGWATPAAAQQAEFAAEADVMIGIEGGSSGAAEGVRRTRTTLRLGAEGWIDESPDQHIAVAALIEVEPHASFGADLRYVHIFGDDFGLHVGATAIIAPHYMIGATFGATYRIPVAEHFAVAVGPTATVYFIGSDLPEDQILWQAMGQVGAYVAF